MFKASTLVREEWPTCLATCDPSSLSTCFPTGAAACRDTPCEQGRHPCDMTADGGSHNRPGQVSSDMGPPRWSAVQAAREAGVSRSTIHEALKSGRLQATKDDAGAWRITPDALRAAGFAPGRQTKVHQPPEDRDHDDTARLRLELAEARADVRVAVVERDAERRLRESVERERDLYRRMIEAPTQSAPESPRNAAPPIPDQVSSLGPYRQSRANVSRLRRAWNVLRY